MGGKLEFYKGSCIFSAAKRVLVLRPWNFDYGQVARHIEKAFTQPENTVPFKSVQKHIPGNWNAPKGTPERDPLTRIDSQSNRYNQNTKAKNLVCEEFFADRPRKKNGAPEDEWQQCDEYPFASTKEGGAYDHPQYGKDNFSVQAVLGTHNSTAGGDLAVFYARYRVLLGNKFWVAVQ
ncbi:NucA/NucB deoxyribonuclease domain-containing protein [Nonomuraea salmonea]|uniref:NucA/NucB deoxyribonuclease domain-containing protein n=1 Tax=Nonomuraea salmonea TaxID=46181 RepID=A0ABV5NCT0_9ACTN